MARGYGLLEAITYSSGPSFTVLSRRSIPLSAPLQHDPSHPNFDIARDGKILFVREAGGQPTPIIIHNWAQEVRALVNGGRKP